MKRMALVLVLLAGVLLAGKTQQRVYDMGNASGSTIRGIAADTISLGSWLYGLKGGLFYFYARPKGESLPKVVPDIQYRLVPSGNWLSMTSAADTWSYTGETATLLGDYNVMLFPDFAPIANGTNKKLFQARVVITGADSGQVARLCKLVMMRHD